MDRYARFYAPIAVVPIALSGLPPFNDVTEGDVTTTFGTLWDMARSQAGDPAVLGLMLLRERIFIIGTSVNVRRGHQRLVDRGPILIDGQTGEILFSAGPHPLRELMDGSFDIRLALPGFCDILS